MRKALPRRYARALPLLRTGLVMTCLMLLASWCSWSTEPRGAFERRGTRPSHAWRTGSRASVLRGSDRMLTTFGFLVVGKQLQDDATVRDPGPCMPLPAPPTIRRRGRTFVDRASGRVCTLCQHPERSTRGWCLGAAGARARGAAPQIWLDGSARHRIVYLLQGGKVVSVLCAVYGSYGGRVV